MFYRQNVSVVGAKRKRMLLHDRSRLTDDKLGTDVSEFLCQKSYTVYAWAFGKGDQIDNPYFYSREWARSCQFRIPAQYAVPRGQNQDIGSLQTSEDFWRRLEMSRSHTSDLRVRLVPIISELLPREYQTLECFQGKSGEISVRWTCYRGFHSCRLQSRDPETTLGRQAIKGRACLVEL